MSQTTAPLRNMVAGKPGLAAEPFGPMDVRTVTNASGKLYHGRMAIIVNSNEELATHPSATGQKMAGVVMASHAVVSADDGDDPNYAQKATGQVLRKGYIWVVIEETVAIGDAVYVRHTAGTGTKLGAFRNDADTATCDLLSNARWVKGGTGSEGIALLELDVL